jgi:hypothetical protein
MLISIFTVSRAPLDVAGSPDLVFSANSPGLVLITARGVAEKRNRSEGVLVSRGKLMNKGVSASLLCLTGAGLRATAAPAAANTYCRQSRGASVYAGNPAMSCGFALSTAAAYHSYDNGSQLFSVSSPTTVLTYTMTRSHSGSVCQGGNNAVVYLS